ncbi:MAG TPA: leucine--tRNA ligase, partial [Patescibacteria group bacterium]|nr:leucine--tRNA ligase [Patescibacteria group bacterium]
WQKFWDKKKLFEVMKDTKKEKYYALIEFPYPSSEGLHVGHPRSYTAIDVVARKRRMQGYNVLYPIGWDAFGLPAENYAIKTGTHPKQTTEENITNFRRQLKSIGFSFDWSREINTTDPKYYQWTQWIFLKLFERGLAYKEESAINFCVDCRVGLANEEVVGGKCERCGGEVVKRIKKQWMLKITDYADRLEKDLDKVDYWEKIKLQQKNWIGRSEGADVVFPIVIPRERSDRGDPVVIDGIASSPTASRNDVIRVYTTRPDTLFGATYMVLSPEHSLVQKLKDKIENFDEAQKYIKDVAKKSDLERTELAKDKTGVELKGIKAINPASGKEIPIWISDYVLISYGTGAIMAVPAHDQRDWEFAKKFKLDIIEVISGGDIKQKAFVNIDEGKMVNSDFLDGLLPKDAIIKMTKWLEDKGVGKKAVNYKLRDWVFSRQRYWGEPIPLIFCEDCKKSMAKTKNKKQKTKFTEGELLNPGWFTDENLPLELPEVKEFQAGEDGESPLAKLETWVKVKCPKCGGEARRETDTMPQWAGSSWYFLRYTDPKNNKELASAKALKYWTPVDWYNGGMEHTTLHLLYSRFWHKFLFDIGAVPTDEPYTKRTSQGMILGEGGEKMSKSRGNVVNPDDVIKEYGADTLRVYEMFMGPFDQAIPWDTKGVVGVRRFLDKVWNLFVERGTWNVEQKDDKEVEILLHQTIKKVAEDIEEMKFNTAVSAMMILTNMMVEKKSISQEAIEKFLILLSPFAPHIAEELWQQLGHKDSIAFEPWPKYDASKIQDESVEFVIQINGKVRAKIMLSPNVTEDSAVSAVKQLGSIKKYLDGQKIKKVIFVPGRLISFVI